MDNIPDYQIIANDLHDVQHFEHMKFGVPNYLHCFIMGLTRCNDGVKKLRRRDVFTEKLLPAEPAWHHRSKKLGHCTIFARAMS